MHFLNWNTLRPILLLLAAFPLLQIIPSATSIAKELRIGPFSDLSVSSELPPEWEPLRFPKVERITIYKLHNDAGRTVVKAESRNGASGLIYRKRIDPRQYPYIRWSWKIEGVPLKGDVSLKSGDDCAARLYVAFAYDESETSWLERLWHSTTNLFAGEELPGSALTYIWAGKAPKNQIVDSAYTNSAKMFIVQSGNSRSKGWIDERRNLLDDYRLAFGREPTEIIGIALMTDTDNTGEDIVAYYGDISLEASSPQPVLTD